MEANLYSVIHSWFYNQHQLRVQVVEDQNQAAKLKIGYGSNTLYFELEGRPDGLRPHSKESYFHYLQDVVQKSHRDKIPFCLANDDRDALEEEAALYLLRAQAYFRNGQHQSSEKDLLLVMTSLEYIVGESRDPVVCEHFSKFLDVLTLIYQKNLALFFQQQGDYEAAGFTSQWAKRSLEKMYARASSSGFYFSEKDLKAMSCFTLDHADRPKIPLRNLNYRPFMEEPAFAK